jgi:hypothetical protein
MGQTKGVDGVSSSGDSYFDGRHGVEQFPGVPYGPPDFNDPVWLYNSLLIYLI